jgi:hypothetical protein
MLHYWSLRDDAVLRRQRSAIEKVLIDEKFFIGELGNLLKMQGQ